MNIKILDSWLREYIKTNATPQKLAEIMSLTSVGVEHIEKYKNDYIYDIEVTTNRPDLMSVLGLAKEAAIVLPEHGIPATLQPPKLLELKSYDSSPEYEIIVDNLLVRRVCSAVLNVTLKESPDYVKERLEASGIRSINNVIDITNYMMRLTGYPMHVFDFDRLTTKRLIIRESKKGEEIITLDNKKYSLPGGDIVADNGKGEIIDLVGIMGTANSVITEATKRVLLWAVNVEPNHIRRTSMALGIRTEAAILNEKDIPPELAVHFLVHSINMFKELADGTSFTPIIAQGYSFGPPPVIKLEKKKITSSIGIDIPIGTIRNILDKLGMTYDETEHEFAIRAVPNERLKDVTIPEDLIEEIARIYGYHNIPSALAPLATDNLATYADSFYWENKIKDAMRYWGFTEVYTYSMVSESLFEGELSEAVTINNPLNEEMIYLRKTLVPSLLMVIQENKSRERIQIFEIANVYHKRSKNLPDEQLHLAGVMKKPQISFFEAKGLFEQLVYDLGIKQLTFKPIDSGSAGAEMYIGNEKLGDIEILDEQTLDFEVDFATLIKHATLHKVYTPLAKYPPVIEDMTFVIQENVTVGELQTHIKQQSALIKDVVLLDTYENTRTFRIYYQHAEKNLTTEDIAPIREKIAKTLKEKLNATVK